MIEYLHVHEDADLSMGIFRLQRGACLPLHNHPGMTVLSRHVAWCLAYLLINASSRDGLHDECGWSFSHALLTRLACLSVYPCHSLGPTWHARITCCYGTFSLSVCASNQCEQWAQGAVWGHARARV